MKVINCVFIGLSLVVSLSLQCPQGWRQSTVDPNKCYFVSVQKKIWFEADSVCSSIVPNAHLTSIASAFELFALNAIVIDTHDVSLCDQFWIGANDFDQNGQFAWIDGRPFSYTKWAPGQPDLSNQCVSSTARTTGVWKTEPCGVENCFICESYSGSQTTNFPPTTTTTIPTTASTTLPPTTTVDPTTMTDCYDWLHRGGATHSGTYMIYPPGIQPFNVHCDMDTDGGGWSEFQRRIDNTEVFWNRLWTEYKNGFGSIPSNRNFWLGLDRINVLTTKDADVTLRIDLQGNRCQSSCGNMNFDPNDSWFGEWKVQVGNEASNYTFNVSTPIAGNLSTIGDENDNLYFYSNNQVFSTIDRDFTTTGCVSFRQIGAWWHTDCGFIFLNGKYDPPSWGDAGFVYRRQQNFKQDYYINPVQSEMKIRKNV